MGRLPGRAAQDWAALRTGPLIWAPRVCWAVPKIGYQPHATVLLEDSNVQVLVGGAPTSVHDHRHEPSGGPDMPRPSVETRRPHAVYGHPHTRGAHFRTVSFECREPTSGAHRATVWPSRESLRFPCWPLTRPSHLRFA